jgi:hypothetical protein
LLDVVKKSSIWSGGEVDFIIRNQVDDMVLKRGIYCVAKGEDDSNFSTMILPKRSAFVKVKPSLSSFGRIECCLVYELVDQRSEKKPVMEFHQVFIAVSVFAVPLIKKCKASAVMFMARKDQFIGSKQDMKRLKKGVLREHLVNKTYAFLCNIKGQALRLKVSLHPGRQTSIEVTLEETDGRVDNGPIPY